jgi:hypothetical protein
MKSIDMLPAAYRTSSAARRRCQRLLPWPLPRSLPAGYILSAMACIEMPGKRACTLARTSAFSDGVPLAATRDSAARA